MGIKITLIIIVILTAALIFFYGWFAKDEDQRNLYSPSASLDQAVHKANLIGAIRMDNYPKAELAVEGHVILGTQTNEKITTVYTVSSWALLGFENEVFTRRSAASAIPTVITFSQNDKGEYVLENYQEPQSGSALGASLKKMFPQEYIADALNSAKFKNELLKQQEAQAMEYLNKIGRNAQIDLGYVEKELPKIDVEASNTLLGMRSDSATMNNFPYWLGTTEYLEHGTRYIYKTAQSKTDDEHDLIIFTKKNEDGKVIATYRYKIVGSKVVLQ